ncbi:isochorismatase [Vogesella sp. EB]|uniref:cysteine hydrolase family protein n=1 Tax=Vogesella sp. EB TaxID=1526735 RepID=UPI00064D6032|nr:cysteine hydrolase family protein [Vogesella sp. EB]KMJ53973.1 isochorismatase [Vogesella sp. EB]
MSTPKRALIVIDVQNEYFTGKLGISYPDPAITLPNVGRAMDAASAAGIPVVVVQHITPPGAPIFAEGSHGAALHPSIAERPRDHLISKQLASCFTGTDLADWLRSRDIDTLSIVGYMTHNCDASTALHASHDGWQVELLSDASGSLPYRNRAGSASAEEIHRVFTVVMQTGFAAVASTDDWIAAVQAGQPLAATEGVLGSHLQAVPQ